MSEAAASVDSFIHLDLQNMQKAERTFRRTYPAFARTSLLNILRSTEYGRLDELRQIYLDYTGGGLYAEK